VISEFAMMPDSRLYTISRLPVLFRPAIRQRALPAISSNRRRPQINSPHADDVRIWGLRVLLVGRGNMMLAAVSLRGVVSGAAAMLFSSYFFRKVRI